MWKQLPFLFYLAFGLGVSPSAAQNILYDNHVYDARIHTAVLHSADKTYAYPIIFLRDNNPLTLLFDEWIAPTDYYSHYNVSYIQCDANWEPSSLMPIQFYEGQQSPTITEYQYSENTKVPYIHYRFQFPQEGERFKMSGNYILLVYKNGDKDQPVLTKRFVVVEENMEIELIMQLGRQLRQRFSEFHFRVKNTNGCPVYIPNNDLIVKVMQNFRWDNAQTVKTQMFFDNVYRYDVFINDMFDCGNEFRTLDVSSTRFYGRSVESVKDQDSLWQVYLRKETPRPMNQYQALMDFNGAFMINMMDVTQAWMNPDWVSDYVKVRFTLGADEYPHMNIHVIGAFCDWKTSHQNRLSYNPRTRVYEGDIWLKQGQYDYQYVMKNPVTGQLIESAVEGKRTDSENFYTILVYCKSPTDFSHRLVAYFPINY